jgi:dihydrodipicolinate synthase/N-acetylneuraminate lyase
VLHQGAIPVFADIDPRTFSIDPGSVSRRVTSLTRAIIPVGLYGLSADMDPIMSIAKEHDLAVIEDNAQCFLATDKGRLAGTTGHLASFSLQASKHVTSGDGGVIITDDENLATAARKFSCFGYHSLRAGSTGVMPKNERGQPDSVRHDFLGWNYRMSELQAAVALEQTERIDELVERHATAGEGYALNDARFRQVVDIFAGLTIRDGLDPQIGFVGLSMARIMERFQTAYDMGIRMFQISLPSWGALDEPEALLYLKTVCGRFPDCRFLHYNLPRAKRIIRGAEYDRTCEVVPNLVATKNSSTDYARTADLMRNAPRLQHFFLEGNFALGCTLGECSLLCSYDALYPKSTWQFFEAGVNRDLPELFRIARLLWETGEDLFAHCTRDMIDGSYDKTFMGLRNPWFSNRMLPPYIGFSEEESRKCREVFEQKYAQVP